MKLTREEIELMNQALESWVGQPAMSSLLAGMVCAGLRGPGFSKEDAEKAAKEAADEADAKVRARRERAILLQAKLIQMRDSAEIEEVTK